MPPPALEQPPPPDDDPSGDPLRVAWPAG